MDLGKLTTRITFQAKSVTRDALGGEVITWVDQFSVWAKALPLRGRDFFAAMQAQSEMTIEFAMRYRAEVLSTWRVLWRGRQYDIIGDPPDMDGRRTEMVIRCRTAQN